MKLTKLEKKILKCGVSTFKHIMCKHLAVLVIHNESKEIIHIMRFTLFRKWIKTAGEPKDDYTYKLKLLL